MRHRHAAGLILLALAGPGAGWLSGPPAAAAGFAVPAPVTRTLANGLTVAVFQDDRLPIVQIQVLVPAGSVHEPAGEAGVANLTFQMLGEGTASRTAAAFSAAVEALGGAVGGNASREFTAVSGSFLAADFEAGLELLADAVVHPIFPDPSFQVMRGELPGGLARLRQNPATLADEHLWAAVFAGHPYARPPLGVPGALSVLGVDQLRAFHRQRYRPDGALLAIAGDVTPERAFRAAEELLGSWGGRTGGPSPGPLPAPPSGWRVRIVDAPGSSRAEVRIGTLGPPRASGDFEPLTVAGELLAGSPQAGLRVSITGLREAGLISMAASAPVDSVGEALARWRAAIAGWVAAPAGAEALGQARRRLTGGFALQFETLSGWIAQWMAAALYGAPGAALGGFEERIATYPAEAIHAAVRRWVSPDRLVLVVVGPAERLTRELAGIGTIELVSAEAAAELIETPATATSPPRPEQLDKGRQLAAQAAAAHGGLERLRGIRDSSIEGDVVMAPETTPLRGRIRQLRQEPGRFLFSTTFQNLEVLQVLDGTRGWGRMGEAGAPPESLDSIAVLGLRAGFRSDLPHLLLAALDPAARVAWRGQERRDDRDTDVLEVVAADGERRLLFLDPTTHQLVAMEQNEAGHVARRLYRDLRPVDGVVWPFSEERLLDGHRAMVLTWSRVAFNTGLEEALFRMPGSEPGSDPTKPRRPRPR